MPLPSYYREFSPGPFLVGLVECFWTSTVISAPQTLSTHRVLPDGCMDVLFDFRAADSQRASVIGTMIRPHLVTMAGSVDLLGVRFRPGGLAALFSLDAAQLTNAKVDLTNFWGYLAHDAWHRLGEATPAKRIGLLREMLGVRARVRTPVDPFIDHCIKRMEAVRGNLRISDLEKSTGLGARQLERKFARQLGISPKTFARVVRFKNVAAAAGVPLPDWARLAADLGYADQPHLVREFKTFAGLTPSDYQATMHHPP